MDCNHRRTAGVALVGGLFLLLFLISLLLLLTCNKQILSRNINICKNISQLDEVLKEEPEDALHRLTMVTDNIGNG